MAYFGFDTRENRIAWGLVCVFVVVGAAFAIPGSLTLKKCHVQFERCLCVNGTPSTSSRFTCLDRTNIQAELTRAEGCTAQLQRCRATPAIICAIGAFCLLLLSWLPCCYFCCCAQQPKPPDQLNGAMFAATNGVQMAPVATPYHPYAAAAAQQHYMTQPFAAQPYGPPPMAYPTQPQQPLSVGSLPATGTPAAGTYPAPLPQQPSSRYEAPGTPVHRY